MTHKDKITPKTLYKTCSKFGIDQNSPLLFGLCAIYHSALTYIRTVDGLIADVEHELLVPHLLWTKEAAERVRIEAEGIQSVFFWDLLESVESDRKERREPVPVGDAKLEEERSLRQELEGLFKKKESKHASLLANNITEIYCGLKSINRTYQALPQVLTIEALEDKLWDIYGGLYYHLIPNHLRDLISEPGIFSPGLPSTLINYLEEISE